MPPGRKQEAPAHPQNWSRTPSARKLALILGTGCCVITALLRAETSLSRGLRPFVSNPLVAAGGFVAGSVAKLIFCYMSFVAGGPPQAGCKSYDSGRLLKLVCVLLPHFAKCGIA